MPKQQWNLVLLVLGAFALRVIVAITYLKPVHPDEFYQGIELAHLLNVGESRYVIEILYHLRNLTLTTLFRGIHEILDLLQISTPYTRLVAPRLFVVVCDMIMFWAAYQKLKANGLASYRHVMWVLGVLGFTYFTLRDAPSTTLEHLSAILMWTAVGLFACAPRKWTLLLGGAVLALIGVIRYPSALFSVGVLISMILSCCRGSMRWRQFALVFVGFCVGIVIGGFADWWVYGRPYESAWMYVQFNVLTGVSAERFGTSSIFLYADMFTNRFGYVMAVASLSLLPFAVMRFCKELKRLEPAAWGCAFYVLGHFIPAHKEGRFMIPIFAFALWYMTVGLIDFMQENETWRAWFKKRRRILLCAVVLFALLPNAGHTFIILRGDFARHRMTYLNMVSSDWPDDVCAIVSGISLPSYMFADSPKVTGIQQMRREDIFTERHLQDVLWQREPKACKEPGKSIYLVHENVDKDFIAERCVPAWDANLYMQLVKLTSKNNPLWKCKLRDDELAGWQLLRTATRFPPLRELPPLGLKSRAFEAFVEDVAGEKLPEEHLPR